MYDRPKIVENGRRFATGETESAPVELADGAEFVPLADLSPLGAVATSRMGSRLEGWVGEGLRMGKRGGYASSWAQPPFSLSPDPAFLLSFCLPALLCSANPATLLCSQV